MNSAGMTALLQPEGWQLLETLPPYDDDQALALGQKLRDQGHSPDLVAAALTQSRLRAKAASKFGPFAASMLFTPAGLEQATRFQVAARHANRFVDAGAKHVWDLGCGIGADAMACAALDLPVTAVDKDEMTAAAATVNLRHWEHAKVVHADVQASDAVSVASTDGVFLDPARRTTSGKRIFNPKYCEPGWDFVLQTCRSAAAAGVKTAPGISDDHLPDDAEAQWISVDGNVVEAGLWFGGAARDGIRRSAVVMSEKTNMRAIVVDSSDHLRHQVDVGELGEYVYEPDGAIIRAGVMLAVADDLGARLFDRSIAYLTSDEHRDSLVAASYRVVESMPFGVKRLRQYLSDRKVGQVTIKKRGTAVTPEELRKQLKLDGPNSATIIMTRVAGKQTILVVDPMPAPAMPAGL